jgi:hypothetical protein
MLVCFSIAVGCGERDARQTKPVPTPQSGDAGEAPSPSGTLSGYEYHLVGESLLQLTDQSVGGAGSLVFVRSLSTKKPTHRFLLDLTLSDGGALSLVAFSDAALEGGVVVRFERHARKLRVVVGDSAEDLSDAAADAATLSLVVDVEHQQPIPRIVVRRPGSPVLLWDSAATQLALTQGRGDRWGLKLDGSVAKSIKLSHPTSYAVTHLLQAAEKATDRFERLAMPGAKFKSVKTWKTDTDVWAKLTYANAGGSATDADAFLFLACHFHGANLACHKKSESDLSEPVDAESDESDLPPIDSDLPPL